MLKKYTISFVVLSCIIIASTSYLVADVFDDYKNAPPLMRFHIVAHSDSDADQVVKLVVRDAVLAFLVQLDTGSGYVDRQSLEKNLSRIKQVANEALATTGIAYDAQVQLGKYNFPTKTYNTFALPAGKYEALLIILGEGEGKNWWCVIFPALCLTQETVDMSDHLGTEVKWKTIHVISKWWQRVRSNK